MLLFRREDYEFELPAAAIAQAPMAHRDGSRLLVACGSEPAQHRVFSQIGAYFRAGDLLVLNQTKVMNARCHARKDTGTQIEVFVLGMPAEGGMTPVLLRPAKRVRAGMKLQFPHSGHAALVLEKGDQGRAMLDFRSLEALQEVLERDGELPLPPYIKREDGPDAEDATRYQTVFARDLGAVAAPTAGLHFTEALLDGLRAQGVEVRAITHHVGIGTFKPLLVDDVREHQMEVENYQIDPETAQALNLAKREKRRIIAVGTTSTRCLESNIARSTAADSFTAGHFATNLFIYPGYQFKAIQGLITNFHLPGSSLILLVCALMGRETIFAHYQQAIQIGYRFYSYGDAMLLLPSP